MQPQKNKIIILEPARNDILQIARDHIEQLGPSSVKRITDRLMEAIDRLVAFSLIGQTHPDPMLAAQGYRKLIAAEQYICIYKVLEETVYIYRVVNGEMDYPKLLK